MGYHLSSGSDGAIQLVGEDEIMGEYDDVGADEILGYDEILGARRKPRAMVAKHAPVSARDLYLPLSQTGFNTTVATQNATSLPQVTFRPDRFTVGDSISTVFTLNSLFIGNRLQSVASGGVGCEIFSNKSVGVRLKLDTAIVGHQVVANLTYIGTVTSTGTVTFLAALIGPAVY